MMIKERMRVIMLFSELEFRAIVIPEIEKKRTWKGSSLITPVINEYEESLVNRPSDRVSVEFQWIGSEGMLSH